MGRPREVLEYYAFRNVEEGGNPLIMEIFIIHRPVARVVKVAPGRGFREMTVVLCSLRASRKTCSLCSQN